MDVMMTPKLALSYRSIKSKVTEVKLDYKKGNDVEKSPQFQQQQTIYESLTLERKVTYDRPKVHQKTIQELKDECENSLSHLRQIVTALLKRQGLEFRDISEIKPKEWDDVTIDEIAQAEAQTMLEGDGELSPAKVSDRIVNFAKAISGGDKSKFDLLKKAIDDGFEAARIDFGDELPGVCKETYQLTMEKLEAWINEDKAEECTPEDLTSSLKA
ncbi:MAG: hypothetical protein GX075_05435 [Firmicutes bacterium]|nr:hypothetical protein [Bacillota bacterium]